METKILENSNDYGSVIWWGLAVTIATIIGQIWVFLDTDDPIAREIGIIAGIILWPVSFYFLALKINYLLRPKSVEISDDGAKLIMRLGMKPIIIPWPEFLIIGSHTTIMGKDFGVVQNDIGYYYTIDQSIYLELRDAYRAHMGYNPPANYDDLSPGMEKDRLAMSSGQWNKKYERFKKK